ncbi:hypothetical protein, partial [Enterococcus faecium]|uniref:hypothetical protein n=1 Tax=Enterococcus faecium TaxID=1352 RepID=UPI00292F9C9D
MISMILFSYLQNDFSDVFVCFHIFMRLFDCAKPPSSRQVRTGVLSMYQAKKSLKIKELLIAHTVTALYLKEKR